MEKNRLSARTLALFAAAVILLGTGGFMSTRAALNIVSPNGDATFATNSIDVQLLENGEPVGTQSDLAGEENKIFTSLEGKLVPGKIYPADSVTVRNDGEAEEYVRVLVHKYWSDAASDEDGSSDAKAGDKNKTLRPEYIQLTAADGWIETEAGGDETFALYYNKPLKPADDPVAVFDTIRIDQAVISDDEKPETTVEEKTEGGMKVVTYTYNYADKVFTVEAEVQSVQTHSAAEAIRSLWGVTAEIGDDGTITSISK